MKTVKLTITNVAKGPRGVNQAKGGAILLDPGATAEVEVTEAEAADLSKDWFEVKGKKAEPEKTDTAPKAPFEAKEKSAGWFAIFDAEGKEVGKSFREDDAKAFNALDEAGKQAKVDEALKAAA